MNSRETLHPEEVSEVWLQEPFFFFLIPTPVNEATALRRLDSRQVKQRCAGRRTRGRAFNMLQQKHLATVGVTTRRENCRN